ncbi:hypothetical protein COOONC_22076 [Cooperia oncophora]
MIPFERSLHAEKQLLYYADTLFLLLCLTPLGSARRCVPSDYDFEYTECGPDGSRWRVAVPLHGTVCDGLPEPTKGLNCSFSCSAGNYLDIMTESCRPCPPGKRALYENNCLIPEGTGWIVRDAELLYIPSPCISRLSFSAKLVRPGFVEFSYRMPKNNRALSLHVDVRNQQCQSYR